MRHCIYLRKSRADAEAEQRGEGETLARHEKSLRELANKMGIKISAVYKEIVSGESISGRPEMQKLLNDISEGMWDGVLVMDIDRLARGNTIDQGIISQTFKYASTTIITPTKTYNPDNEFDEEYFEFGLFMSRREYKTINRRLQRGRLASVKEGKYVGNVAPYGYQRVKIKGDKGYMLEPLPEQAEIVKKIFEWYGQGKQQEDGSIKRIGIALIAKELNAMQLKASTGGVWTSASIRDILRNSTYIGKVRWNRRPAKKKMVNGSVKTERPRSEDMIECDGLHEAIVSKELFEIVQGIMDNNKCPPIGAQKQMQNPFSGLFVCGMCGRKMQRKHTCKSPDLLWCTEPTCDNHGAYIYLVEKSLLETLRQWTEGYAVELQKIRQSNGSTADTKGLLYELEKSKATLTQQLTRTYEAFEKGVYDADVFVERSTVIKADISALDTKIKDLQVATNRNAEAERILTEFLRKVEEVTQVYDTLDDAHAKNNLLKAVVERVDYVKTTVGHGHEEDFELTVYPKIPDR